MNTNLIVTILLGILLTIMTVLYLNKQCITTEDTVKKTDYDQLKSDLLKLIKQNEESSLCCNGATDLMTQRNALLNERDSLVNEKLSNTQKIQDLTTEKDKLLTSLNNITSKYDVCSKGNTNTDQTTLDLQTKLTQCEVARDGCTSNLGVCNKAKDDNLALYTTENGRLNATLVMCSNDRDKCLNVDLPSCTTLKNTCVNTDYATCVAQKTTLVSDNATCNTDKAALSSVYNTFSSLTELKVGNSWITTDIIGNYAWIISIVPEKPITKIYGTSSQGATFFIEITVATNSVRFNGGSLMGTYDPSTKFIFWSDGGVWKYPAKLALTAANLNVPSPLSGVPPTNFINGNLQDFGHTNTDNRVILNLPRPINIAVLILYNRRDCCQDRIVGAVVKVLNGTVEVQSTTINSSDSKIVVPINKVGTTITITNANYINLAEIEVWSYPGTISVSADNCYAFGVAYNTIQGKTAGRTGLLRGSWPQVPVGCNVQSTGDWAVHWNDLSTSTTPANGGGYTTLV